MKKYKLITFASAIITLLAFTGCSKKSDSADGQKQITIRAVTKGTAKPYITRDEAGNLDGYDTAVFRAVFERLPQYKVDLIISADALTGLLSGQYDISFNNWSYNDKRAESYYYSYPYDKVVYDFVQRKGDAPLTSFEDIANRGYAFETTAGFNVANAFEKWNEEHPDKKIKIIYTEADALVLYQHIQDGIYDFRVDDHPITKLYADTYDLSGLQFTQINDEVASSISKSLHSFFLFPKDEKGAKLREDVNKALKQLREDGTLDKLALKYFGTTAQVPELARFEKPIN